VNTDTVQFTVVDQVARVTLNRPDKLNAINGAMHRELVHALHKAGADPAVRVVVIRGNGRAFSAGGDVKAVAAGEDVGRAVDIANAIWLMPKPVVASVHGFCLGQAFEVAAVCDLTIASETARFGEVEINHGWSPPVIVTPHVLGPKAAKEILLLGDIIDAETALRMGLVNRVVQDEQLDSAVDAVTSRLRSLEPRVLAANKALVNSLAGMPAPLLESEQDQLPGTSESQTG